MDNNKVRIKCPCGANLALTKTPGTEAKSFTCPVCKQRHPFSDFAVLPPLQPKPAAPAAASMAADVLDVRCQCGAMLKVRNTPGIENKMLTCPQCHQKRQFTQYIRNNGGTIYGPTPNQAMAPVSDNGQNSAAVKPGTVVLGQHNLSALTQLIDTSTGTSYNLAVGENIVGRKAMSSSASIQIDTADKKLSREHFVITGKAAAPKGYMFLIKLFKPEVNPTTVNGETLAFGDEVFLHNGSRIKVNAVELIFNVLDIESTIC